MLYLVGFSLFTPRRIPQNGNTGFMQGNKRKKNQFLITTNNVRPFSVYFLWVLLTVHLSVILVIKQFDAQNLYPHCRTVHFVESRSSLINKCTYIKFHIKTLKIAATCFDPKIILRELRCSLLKWFLKHSQNNSIILTFWRRNYFFLNFSTPCT